MSDTTSAGADASDFAQLGEVSRDEINAHMLGRLFRRVRPLLVANLGMSWLLVALLWDHAEAFWLVLWAVALSGWTMVRFLVARIYLASPRGVSETRRWTVIFAVGSGIGGLIWGVSVVFFAGFEPQLAQPALMFVIGGLSTAALTGYSNNLTALAAFACPALLPYGWWLIWLDGAFDPWIAGFFAFWMVLLWVMARALHAGFSESVTLHLRNSSLARRLATALERAHAANLAKTRFLGHMSHELRTPLNAIIGYSEMMAQRVFGPIGNERYEAYADDIHGSGLHLLDIVQQILDLSELDAGDAALTEEQVDLASLIDEVVSRVRQTAADKGLDLTVDVGVAVPTIHADPVRLDQALSKLLSNAVAFTPEGGEVVVQAQHRPDQGVSIAVQDTGIGMSREELERVTVPFGAIEQRDHTRRQDHRQEEGVHTRFGLGLPLARLLAELHGGRLELESRPDHGTTARLLLPEARVAGRAQVSATAG